MEKELSPYKKIVAEQAIQITVLKDVIDDFNREALSIAVDTGLPAQRVIRELEQLIE